MVVHLGLPEWHFLFSNIPVSNKARQWFNFFAPTRLLLSSHHIAADNHSSSGDGERRNPNAVFETPLVQNKFDAGNIVQLIVVDVKELCFLSNNNAFLEILSSSSIFIRPFDHEVWERLFFVTATTQVMDLYVLRHFTAFCVLNF